MSRYLTRMFDGARARKASASAALRRTGRSSSSAAKMIRAAGRSSEQILEQLTTRLGNDDETESAVVADQLRQIAVLRLQGAVSP